MRSESLRFELLRNGAYCARLRAPEDEAPRLRCRRGESLKMSFNGTFAPVARDADGNPVEINWYSDEIQPILTIDGVDSPLGAFAVSVPDGLDNGVTDWVQVEAFDRCWRVQRTNSRTRLYWAAGTLVLDAVEQLLSAAGIEVVFKTPSSAAFAVDREEWDIGTSYLDVINQLLDEIGYQSLWFNSQGAAMLEPKGVPEANAIEHVLKIKRPRPDGAPPEELGENEAYLLPGVSRSSDIFKTANVFIAVCAAPDLPENLTATAVNDNPQSPLSTVSRGREICEVIYVNSIEDQAALQNFVDKKRDESMIGGETIRVETGLLPGWGVGDVVGLNYKDVMSVCISQGFEMELRVGGTMTHTLERIVYNLE